LSSPQDVVEERILARKRLQDLQTLPLLRGRITIEVASWDDPNAAPPMIATLTPQEAIRRGLPVPSECDITVCIFWCRMGTPLTDRKPDGSPYLSGTEWEYEDAIKAGKVVLLYRRTSPPAFDQSDPDFEEKSRQHELVKQFFARLQNPDGSLRGSYSTYRDDVEFADRVVRDVQTVLRTLLDESKVESPVAWRQVWRWMRRVAGCMALLTIIGFLDARSFDVAVGRSANFGAEPALSWPFWGAKSLLPLAGVALQLFIMFAVANSVSGWVLKDNLLQIGRRFLERSSRQVGDALLVAHVVALALAVWYFMPVIEALFNQATGPLDQLSPMNRATHEWYGWVLSTALLLFGGAWYELFKVRPAKREFPVVAAASAVLAANLLLITTPHRTLYKNDSERVEYASEVCYLVAVQRDEGLLFCPKSPQRKRTINLLDSSLKRSSVVANIFSEL
jgi:hypothetical protein